MAYSRTLNHFTSMQELATIWASSTSYVVNQLVLQDEKLYRCAVAHTSGGTFIADLQAAYWVEISASEAGVFNYIGNPNAEVDTSGWTIYAESDSVTFTDAGDLVTLNNHGLSNGNEISFTSITSTTGISINTRYFVVSATTNTFQVASSSGGSALPLTTNGSGTMVRFVPKTGSGGSPNITWSRSIVSPLRGDADFNLVKDAANRQGQGVEYDFTIDNADLAKVLTVTFDYEVVSGTLATGDVTVYLIQDPSGTPLVIQPAGYQVQGATVGTKMRQIATFQTASNVTSYRLCLHVSSVSATAYTLAVDNVVVGPQVVQYGAPVTDWTSFTPTGSWTANTTYTGRWRRVGDKMDVEWQVATSGAPTATGLTLNLPAGYAIDTSKILNTTAGEEPLGRGSALDTGVGYYPNLIIRYNNATSVDVLVDFQGAGGTAVYTAATPLTQAVPFTFGSGDKVWASVSVPVAGWSSTVQMSNDTDTRVVAASVSSGTGVNANNTTVQVPFGATVIDTHGGVGTNQYTVPVPGLYRVVVQTRTSFPTSNVSFNHTLSIFKNGVSAAQEAFQGDGSNASVLYWMYGSVNTIIQCNAGDILTVRFGTNYNIGNSNTALTMFSAERLSGPSAIAASETVAARYTIAAQVASSTTQPINYATRVFDTHGAVTTGASWKFTAPVSGLYHVIASGACSSSSTGFFIYKNGIQSIEIGGQSSASAYSQSGMIQLLAGDYIDIRYSSSLNTTATTTQNWVAINRVGN